MSPKALKFFILAVIVILAVGFLSIRTGKYSNKAVDQTVYQGVVLNSGVAYYGHLEIARDYLKLSDVYYLQQSVQEGQPPLNLIKFGTEPQGPQDTMYVNKSQVQYWYNLNSQGELSQKITQAKAQNQKKEEPAKK